MSLWIQALSLLAPVTAAGGEVVEPALVPPVTASDAEPGVLHLQDLVSALDDLQVGGLLRTYYDRIDDELTGTGDDVDGFRLYDAQLWGYAEAFGYGFFVRMDAAEAGAFPPTGSSSGVDDFDVRDAFVRKHLNDEFTMYLGQFKCPLVRSGNMGDGDLGMIERTRIGQLFSAPGAYQPGAALLYDHGPFHGKVVVQNGADEATDGHGIVLRGEYTLNEGTPGHEGALGGSEGFNAVFGAGYFKDDSDIMGDDFGSAWALDAYTTYDQLSVHAEILGADEELASRALGNVDDDATPFTATFGYLFDENWEGFVRYQDLDNEADATVVGAGVNYYVSDNLAKWQINVSQYDDDDADGLILQVGFSIGLSQPEGIYARP